MEQKEPYFARQIDEGMGMAVAKRTYLRPGECWADVAMRVAEGNCSLVPTSKEEEFELTKTIAKASFLPAGRHLQHGDRNQSTRNIEVFSNCSTACASFIKFYLLLNGSGVGRMYNDDMMIVDWRNQPDLMLLLDEKHKDYPEFIRLLYSTRIREYLHNRAFLDKHPKFDAYWLDYGSNLYADDITNALNSGYPIETHTMGDSREGWAKGLEIMETMAFEKKRDYKFILDCSEVRESGSPIHGMQNRPASGPAFTAYAFWKISKIKRNTFSYFDAGLDSEVEWAISPDPWLQTILVDHYASECVANGGARRSARISVKVWTDPGIFNFINLKHTFTNTSGESILWSSNNSVGVDQEFWQYANVPGTHANKVFKAIVDASYGHGTGEPGMVNLDKLTVNEAGIDDNSLSKGD